MRLKYFIKSKVRPDECLPWNKSISSSVCAPYAAIKAPRLGRKPVICCGKRCPHCNKIWWHIMDPQTLYSCANTVMGRVCEFSGTPSILFKGKVRAIMKSHGNPSGNCWNTSSNLSSNPSGSNFSSEDEIPSTPRAELCLSLPIALLRLGRSKSTRMGSCKGRCEIRSLSSWSTKGCWGGTVQRGTQYSASLLATSLGFMRVLVCLSFTRLGKSVGHGCTCSEMRPSSLAQMTPDDSRKAMGFATWNLSTRGSFKCSCCAGMSQVAVTSHSTTSTTCVTGALHDPRMEEKACLDPRYLLSRCCAYLRLSP